MLVNMERPLGIYASAASRRDLARRRARRRRAALASRTAGAASWLGALTLAAAVLQLLAT